MFGFCASAVVFVQKGLKLLSEDRSKPFFGGKRRRGWEGHLILALTRRWVEKLQTPMWLEPSSYEQYMVITSNRYCIISNQEKKMKIDKHLATRIRADAEAKAVRKRPKPV